jgi:hypothetical protein
MPSPILLSVVLAGCGVPVKMPSVAPMAGCGVPVKMPSVAPMAVLPVIRTVKTTLSSLKWEAELQGWQVSPMRLGVDVAVCENSKGKGLYALRRLEEGELIERYTGTLMGEREYAESDNTGEYAMALCNGDVIIADDPQRSSFVRYVNHSVRKANTEAVDPWEEDSWLGTAYLQTTREIAPGEELLFDYGPDYWDGLLTGFSKLKRFQIDYL